MRRICLLFIFLLAAGSPAFAWTSKTYQLVVVKSLKLMPVSFQHIMLQHQEEILRGCLQPDAGDESRHTYDLNTRSGYIQDRILELSAGIPVKIEKHVPFKEIAFDFGSLSHYLSDLNNPLIIGSNDSREPQYANDFAMYMEKNIDLFPWIFDGHENATLQSGKEKDYLYGIASAAVEKYDRIGEAYFPEGTLVSSETFDPKSLPFGIASLSYSRSISDTVQVWFYVWRKSHGDVTVTPFYSKQHPRSHHEN